MQMPSLSPTAIDQRLLKAVRLVRNEGLTLVLAAKRAHCCRRKLAQHMESIGQATKRQKALKQPEL